MSATLEQLPAATRQLWLDEAWQQARTAFLQQDDAACLAHLELVHILAQSEFWPHLHCHWWMLRAGWRRRDFAEVRGQWLRLLLTPLGHLTGRLPAGNNGRAQQHPLRPQPLPAQLQQRLAHTTKTGAASAR